MAAVALMGLAGVALVAIGSGFYAFLVYDREFMKITIFCVCLVVALALLYRVMAGSASCPLCRNQPLISKGCQKHRKARRLFGSYRYRVAGAVLLTGSFRCPYCGESTACRVRSRKSYDENQELS